MLASILSLCRALFDIGTRELQEPMTPDGHDLAMRIPAVLRRMLPALRVAGKWLRMKHNLNLILASSSTATQSFWLSYSAFFIRIAEVFPPGQLSVLRRQLDEDIELVGYQPLGGLLISRTSPEVIASEDRRALEEVHPNEEQLMRIWDIWHDASLVAELAPAQMRSFRAQPSSRPRASKTQTPGAVKGPQPRAEVLPDRASSRYPGARTASSVDEDARTETTDPVGDAFRQALGEDDDTDDEEILFNPRYARSRKLAMCLDSCGNRASIMSVAPEPAEPPTSTQHTPTKQMPLHSSSSGAALFSSQPTPAAHAITPPESSVPGSTVSLATSTHPSAHRASFSSSTPALPHTPKTTAQDLLANVLGRGVPSRTARRVSHSPSFAPAHVSSQATSEPRASSLLASNSPAAALGAGHSIWSASTNQDPVGVHHRRLSQSGLHGATNLRSMSQPPPWAATPELTPGQRPLYRTTPPPPVHNSAPPGSFPASVQQSTLQDNLGIGLGPHPPNATAYRRLSGSNTSSLLAQHSYLPPLTQPATYTAPAYSQPAQQGPLPRMIDNMHLTGAQRSTETYAAQGVGDMRAYSAISGMPKGSASYTSALQPASLGLAGSIWGPAG